jgi:APA family basic amino acid/polyamine antiporter
MLNQLLATKPIGDLDAVAKSGDLNRALGPWALTALGIGAIIGTGIFVLTGIAAANNAGPALALSFVVAGAVCALAALCYSEFASMIPVAGSAYSYSYTTMGEGMAWFIGWNLVLEYLVSISAVSVGWSGYATQFINTALGWINSGPLPTWLTQSPLAKGVGMFEIVRTDAIVNLPAVLIIAIITGVCYYGIKQSSALNAIIVAIKITAIVAFIAFGVWYVNPVNWDPFIPERICDTAATVTAQCRPGHYGWFGIIEGASIIFFAYIGFDAVSTAAQEAKNPQRDMPIGIMASLAICTLLYITVSLVLTGMMPYGEFKMIAHPVSHAVQSVPALSWWLAPLIELGAIAGLSSVILVMMIGQPRIFYAMARDGLLPPVFAKVHPVHQTPHINTVITGVIAALLGGFLPIDILAELTNIGTLIAFMAVCIGVLVLRRTRPDLPRPFKTPMPWLVCTLGAAGCLYLIYGLPYDTWVRLIVWTILGAVVYFAYGFWHSKLRRA